MRVCVLRIKKKREHTCESACLTDSHITDMDIKCRTGRYSYTTNICAVLCVSLDNIMDGFGAHCYIFSGSFHYRRCGFLRTLYTVKFLLLTRSYIELKVANLIPQKSDIL